MRYQTVLICSECNRVRYNVCIYTGGYYCQETDKEGQMGLFVWIKRVSTQFLGTYRVAISRMHRMYSERLQSFLVRESRRLSRFTNVGIFLSSHDAFFNGRRGYECFRWFGIVGRFYMVYKLEV